MRFTNASTGQEIILTAEETQQRLRQVFELAGKIIFGHSSPPPIGEVRNFAGLPLRVVRLVSNEEAREYYKLTSGIWIQVGLTGDPEPVPGNTYFEVEVAD
jgi:hypothetical protein